MIRRSLETLTIFLLVACTCWNIWIYGRNSDRLVPREAEDVTVLEAQYQPVQNFLIERNYRNGPVGLINNRVLTGKPSSAADTGRSAQAQYVMVPWVLVLDGRSIPGAPVADVHPRFVIGDFWDGPPEKLPSDLVEIYRGPKIFLFERTRQ
jgi:hypothetical protein